MSETLRVGVVGVGSMGENHARVYSELRDVELVGVTDLDQGQARRVAETYGTESRSLSGLLAACDGVSVAVPTAAHHGTVTSCLDAGVHVLVEKPIADSVEAGRELAARAREAGLVLQVGHVERFNPAVEALGSVLEGLEVIAVEAERLGPPVDRSGTDGVVLDLMIHDLDVVRSILGTEPESIGAMGAGDGAYATARMAFPDEVIVSLTASRITQKKVRRLTVTARECLVEVDYLTQSVRIHRNSYPEYVADDGRSRYRHESVVERPRVEAGEPLRRELEGFLDACRNGTEPPVTAEDGIRALELAVRIDRLAAAGDRIEVRAE